MIRRFTSRSGNQTKRFVSPPVNLKTINLSSFLMKRGITLFLLLLSLVFTQNQLKAQCDIGYTGSQSITLSLDETGIATINSVLFETYVSSSNAACHPNGGGAINLYVDSGKTMVFPATNYNCTDINTDVDVFVALMNSSGNESAAIPFEITIVDAFTPDLVCAFNATQDLPTNSCTAMVNNLEPITGVDNCNGMSLTYVITGATTDSGNDDASGTSFDPGVSTVTYTATDASGNVNTCSSTVTVSFPQPYTITGCASDITVDVDPGVCTKTVNYSTPTAINSCPITFTAATANVASGSSLMPGTYPIAFTFDNGTDNVACNFTITVEDNEDPEITISNQSITTSGCQANYSFNATSNISDNCTAFGDLTMGWNLIGTGTAVSGMGAIIPNQLLDVGDYDITYTAKDEANNTTVLTYTLSVLENIPPVAMTMDITVALDLNGDVTVNAGDLDDGSTDNCSALTFEIMDGGLWGNSVDYDCTDIGANSIDFRALDDNGNISATVTAIINVEDNFVPVAMCQDITVTIPGGTSVTVNAMDIDNGSADNCASIASYEITIDEDNDVNGIFEIPYSTSYTASCPTPATGFVNAKLRVTDNSTIPASAECLAKITILDDTAPVVIAGGVSAFLDGNGEATIYASDLDNGSTEDCGTMTFTFAESATGTFTASKDYTCATAGTYSNIHLKATNSAGLSNVTGPVTLTISDNTAPAANCVAGLTVSYDAAGNISVPATDLNDGSTDNCSVASLRVSDSATGTFATTYNGNCSAPPANLILQVSDGTLSSTCSVPVTVIDNVPPTAVCHTNLSVSLISNSVVIFASQIDAGSVDACNPAAPSLAVTRVVNNVPGTYSNNVSFDCSDITATQMVRLQVTDGSGLTSTCNSFIDVQETQPPVFGASFPSSPQTVECSDYSNNVSLSFDAAAMASATDNCGAVTVTFDDSGSLTTNACSASTITRTYTAVDVSSNSSTMTVTINVTDTTMPTFTRPGDVMLECDASAGVPYSEANAGEPTNESDNCDTEVADGGLREASSTTYHGFFDFKDHTGEVAMAYNFAPSQWSSSNASLVNIAAAPDLIKLTSPNSGSAGQTDFTINVPATGWIVFDYFTSSTDAAADDPFGYTINGTFTALEVGSSLIRAIVPVTLGQSFAFAQESIDGAGGSAVTTVRGFSFVDVAITTPQEIVCANNMDVARFWSLDDCAGNAAADQFQRIRIRDTTAPVFDFDNNFTVDSPETSCAAFVDLDMSVATGRLIEACNLVSVTNTADTDYGLGDGNFDASGFYMPGSHTVTFTAADACNTATTFVINFTVEDNTNPTVICHDLVNVTIPNSGTVTLSPNSVIASATDNCALDNSSFSVTPSTFTNADFGLNPVVLSVTDVNGNTTTCNSVADVAGSIEYDLAEVSGAAGSTINLPVVTRHFTDVNAFSMSVNLVDPAVATIVEVTDFHPSLTGTGNFNIVNPGQVDVSYFDANTTLPDLDDVVLFNVRIQFNPLALPGDITDVTLSNIFSSRDDAAGNPQSVPTLGLAGSAEVAAASALRTISGNIRTITSPVESVDSVTVNLTGTTVNSMLTTTDGNYSFDVPSGADQTVTPYKNINWRNGGNVNILDVLALHRLSLGIDSYSSTSQEVAADSDGMNGVNILDVLLAHRISLGIIEEIPTNTSWRFVDSDLGVPAAPLTNGFAEGRTYNNITTDIIDADFLGIKVCNIVGASSGAGFMSDDADERDEPLYFSVDNFELITGQDYAVEVKAKDFNHISAYQYNLLLNTEYAQLNSVTPGVISNMTLDNFNTLNSAAGVIGTDWYELHPMDVVNETVLFTLNFTATEGGIQLSEILSIDKENELAFHANGNSEVGDVELEFNTTTAVSPVAENDFALLQNKPNPFSSETIISFVLPENAETTLTIIDVAGKAVFQTKTQAQKGYNELKINANDLPSTGVFHYHLDSEVGAAVRKMVILR